MTQVQQPEALRLAAICETKGMFPVADELNRMHARILELELEQGKCLHQIAEPAANLTSELADMLERSVTGLGHYRNSQNWSEADEEHIHECNALLERFNSSDDEREAAPQAVQAAGATLPWPRAEVSDLLERLVSSHISALIAGERGSNKPEVREFIKSALVEAAGFIRAMLDSAQEVPPQSVQPAVPMFWVRLLRDGLYEGPVHNNSTEGKLLRDEKPAEWHPLYLQAAPAHPAEGVPAQAFKTKVFQALGIGSACDEHVVFVNIENLSRRADCLSAIEREFFMVETPPDESEGDLEPGEECLLNWAHSPEQYVKQFAEALAATQPAAQGLDIPVSPHLGDHWKVALLDGRTLERDENGMGWHPALPSFDEATDTRKFYEAFGMEICQVSAESELEWEEYDRLAGLEPNGEFNFSEWTPKAPEGEGWKLVSIHDTEDGPYAWWLRDKPVTATAKHYGI